MYRYSLFLNRRDFFVFVVRSASKILQQFAGYIGSCGDEKRKLPKQSDQKSQSRIRPTMAPSNDRSAAAALKSALR
jgi:hypothetical protein